MKVPPFDFLDAQFSFPRAPAQIFGFGGDLLERLAVGAVNNGHYQAFFERYRHADIDFAGQDDCPLGKRGVQPGMAPQSAGHGVDHQVGVGEFPFADELGAQVSGGGDVRLGGDSQLRRAVQALHHALGNGLANSLERNA